MDVRKELAALDQAIALQKTEPSPNSSTEPAMPKTDPQKEETEELHRSPRQHPSPRKKRSNRSEVERYEFPCPEEKWPVRPKLRARLLTGPASPERLVVRAQGINEPMLPVFPCVRQRKNP